MSQKRRRLSRSAEFDRVYRQGRSAGGRFLVLYAFERPDDEQQPDDQTEPRLGVSVGRRVGNAVERTEIKRLLREAFWAVAEQLPTGFDYVIVARPECSGLAERERLAGVQNELSELIGKLGLNKAEVAK